MTSALPYGPAGGRASAASGTVSAFGAGIGKAVGSLGGPQVAAIVVAGGLVVGAIGGGMFAGGGVGQAGDVRGLLSIYPCPDSGPALASVGLGPEVPRHRQERRRELGPDLLPAAGPHGGLGARPGRCRSTARSTRAGRARARRSWRAGGLGRRPARR